MTRVLTLSTVLLLGLSPRFSGLRPLWKEDGWISTCAGVGCLGRRSDCFMYSNRGPSGQRHTYYCYLG
jgi:hypothetical protein